MALGIGNLLRKRGKRRLVNLNSLGRFMLIWQMPTIGRLSYHLMLDSRVPKHTKAGALGVIAFVLSPLDIPGWVPVLGQFGDALVIVNVLEYFIKACPRPVVEEHIRALGLEGKYKI